MTQPARVYSPSLKAQTGQVDPKQLNAVVRMLLRLSAKVEEARKGKTEATNGTKDS